MEKSHFILHNIVSIQYIYQRYYYFFMRFIVISNIFYPNNFNGLLNDLGYYYFTGSSETSNILCKM